MQLRPIQTECVEAVFGSFRRGETFTLVEACVSFGKTIVASEIMRRAKVHYEARILFLCHLTELVVQTADKFKRVAPDLDFGLMCGTLGEKHAHDITIGTRQTVANNLEAFDKLNLIIIDEVHQAGNQYLEIIAHFIQKNPRLRVLGVTGTPYSIREGFIYGAGKVWKEPVFRAQIDSMIEMGYLSPYRYKVAQMPNLELESVRKNSMGDYNENDLTEKLTEEHHLGSVKQALSEHCQGRKRIMVFCVSIEHAEKLADYLGVDCVHSKVPREEWVERIRKFRAGESRIIVNVSQLSIGFDCPEVDALVMARPTLSPALFVQSCGRSLRVCEGKGDALIIDLVGNYVRHGLPSDPKVREPKEQQEEKERKIHEDLVCPSCLEVVPKGGACENCGHILATMREIIERHEIQEMREIQTGQAPTIVEEKWVKHGHVTKKGYRGKMLCARVKGRGMIFRFAPDGSERTPNALAKFEAIQVGQRIKLRESKYGLWLW